MGQVTNLGEFILAEMTNREMSARAFARFVGVDSKTINKFLNYGIRDVGYPSVEFLIKLAKATDTDICNLMALVAPEVVRTRGLSPDAAILGQRIEKLAEPYREIIDDILSRHSQ